jgi:hypothetical protein
VATSTDQLVEIFVTGDDDRAHSQLGRLIGQSADHVIGLVTGQLEDGNVEAGKNLANAIHRRVEIFLQRFIQLLTRRLVVGEYLVTEGLLAAGIEDEAEVLRVLFGQQFANELDDSPGGRGILAARGAKWPTDHRVERAVHKRVSVHEKDSADVARLHIVEICRFRGIAPSTNPAHRQEARCARNRRKNKSPGPLGSGRFAGAILMTRD